jgi:hypothetical protein
MYFNLNFNSQILRDDISTVMYRKTIQYILYFLTQTNVVCDGRTFMSYCSVLTTLILTKCSLYKQVILFYIHSGLRA